MSFLVIIGLGYVRLPLAIEYGKKYRVIGFDVNKARVSELEEGNDHTLEADLAVPRHFVAAPRLPFTDTGKPARAEAKRLALKLSPKADS